MTTEEIADRILARMREERRRQRDEVYLESLARIAASAAETWFLGVRRSQIACAYDPDLGYFEVQIGLDLPWWARRDVWQGFIEARIRLSWLEMTGASAGPLMISIGPWR